MSVATEFAPNVTIPARARATMSGGRSAAAAAAPLGAPWREPLPLRPPARRTAGPERGAPVTVLRPPADRAPLRLTRRGMVVLAVGIGLLAGALVWLARLSAPSAGGPAPVGPRLVTVQPGDTMWAIATRVAPGVDPRVEVDRLRRLNALDPGDLVPGQQLRTR